MKIAYLHTPAYHPTHASYALSVGAEFVRIDKYLPYLDRERCGRLRKYASMFINGLFSPARRYDVIITDEVKVEAAIMKLTTFRKKRLLSTQASYTLTYAFEKKLSTVSSFIIKKLANYYDGIFCVGEELFEIAGQVCKGNPSVLIRRIYNGVNDKRIAALSGNAYDPSGQAMVSICNCYSAETYHFKAIDLMVAVFDKLLKEFPALTLTIVGKSLPVLNEKILDGYSTDTRERVSFVPFDPDILKYFRKATVYLQLSRYEAFGIAVAEAATAGLPAFVSNQVGARMMYDTMKEKERFIIENENSDEAVKKIGDFLRETAERRREDSLCFREIVRPYTESNACNNYREAFQELMSS